MKSPSFTTSVPTVKDFMIVADFKCGASGDAALAHSTSDDGGMGGHSTASSENSFGNGHAVNVFGRSFKTNENDFLPVLRPISQRFLNQRRLVRRLLPEKREDLCRSLLYGLGSRPG